LKKPPGFQALNLSSENVVSSLCLQIQLVPLQRGASENGIAAAAKRTAADGDDNRLVVEFPSLRLSDGGATSATRAAAAVVGLYKLNSVYRQLESTPGVNP
jgi:hypothetical protein